MSGAISAKLTCVRPIPSTGYSDLWTRAGRDSARRRDPVLCRCGGNDCRDRELLPKIERPPP